MSKKTAKPKKTTPKTSVKPKKKAARKLNAAFMAALTPSSTLASIIGNKPQPRTKIVQEIWVYIRKHDLQDKANKRMINADSKLKLLFDGRDQLSMFELAKVISAHVSKG